MQCCAPRELVLHRTWREQEDGTFTAVATSVDAEHASLGGSRTRCSNPWLQWLYPPFVRAQVSSACKTLVLLGSAAVVGLQAIDGLCLQQDVLQPLAAVVLPSFCRAQVSSICKLSEHEELLLFESHLAASACCKTCCSNSWL